MTEPAWLTTARGYLGLAEIPGKDTAPAIRRWLIALKAKWTDDETPWCGVFVAECMRANSIDLPSGWPAARGWLKWGVTLPSAVVGAVVVYSRPGSSWSGHVGFVVGRDQAGNVQTLGGNQGNRVSVLPFAPDRVLGYRWPPAVPVPLLAELPVVNSDGKVSTQEG
jgi:uncharacterized protein (TIGR02594 family)